MKPVLQELWTSVEYTHIYYWSGRSEIQGGFCEMDLKDEEVGGGQKDIVSADTYVPEGFSKLRSLWV